LQGYARISNIHNPGLEIHPQRALKESQMKGFGSLGTSDIQKQFIPGSLQIK